MKLEFTKVSPSGNITILIWSDVPRSEHAKIANQLMDSTYHLGAEQVGYVESSPNPKAIAHLQMMGGEFCGNATRALAFILVEKKLPNILINNNIARFYLSVSGVEEPLKVEVECDHKQNPISAKVQMPIYHELNSVCQKDDVTLVSLEGISHIIVDNGKIPFNQEDYKNDFIKLRDDLALQEQEAVGVMWKTLKKDASISMEPVVWVKNTDSYYYETSCGSGTIALALALAKQQTNTYQEFKIYQPSGKYILAIVERDENHFLNAYIKGEVNMIAEGFCFV
ncbi:MAG: Diaminopimelate epimerase [uncultured Sulfurovum sp.]|uniref:Diaminopimelate epimerase n=1 Tax=uncultured Sulfurovum sp. TaxID=269237 RepID=A0A6S6S4R4_9BACT|nr:MAG: Diaminopimelate epimerase [uncultured Sulfurovum sp.]